MSHRHGNAALGEMLSNICRDIGISPRGVRRLLSAGEPESAVRILMDDALRKRGVAIVRLSVFDADGSLRSQVQRHRFGRKTNLKNAYRMLDLEDGRTCLLALAPEKNHASPNSPETGVAAVAGALLGSLPAEALDCPRPNGCPRARILKAIERVADPETFRHESNTALMAVRVAETMGLSVETRESIRIAALFHDIGKLLVPRSVLTKRGRLNSRERTIIRTHPDAGAALVEYLGYDRTVSEIVRRHHERPDGTGYPGGLSGDRIDLASAILHVADFLTAYVEDRPYRPGMPVEAAFAALRDGAGTCFSPLVAQAAADLEGEMLGDDAPLTLRTA